MQAGFNADQVQVAGRSVDYARTSDEADRKIHIFRFCPECGSTVFSTEPDEPEIVVVMVGAFADPEFPPPTESWYGSRRHSWVVLPSDIESDEAWEQLRPLYEAAAYAEVADRGPELIEAHPENARLLYNVACCESLAGRTADAVDGLRMAIERAEELRSLAATDADFDSIRDDPAFRELVG